MQVLVADVGLALEHAGRQHQKARRAEAALQSVVLDERLLQRVQLVAVRQALDGADLASLGLHREHQARAHRFAVDQHRAGAADAVLAADMGPGLAAIVADGIDQGAPRIDAHAVTASVDGEGDLAFLDHAAACSSARRVTVCDEVAAIGCAGRGVLERIDGRRDRRGRGLESRAVRRAAGEHPLGLRDPARLRLHPADRHARLADHAVLHAIGDQRHGERKIAGAAVELVEAEAGVGRKDRQAHFGEKLVLARAPWS